MKKAKVLKIAPDSNTGIQVDEDAVTLTSPNEKTFLSVSKKGIGISGDLNIQGLTSSIKFGGLSAMNQWPLLLLPSTTMSPIPLLTVSLPIENLLDMATAAVSMMALIK